MRPQLIPLTVLLALALASCKHDADLPQARCYAGVVVGESCYDGLLINVDAQYALGKPVGYGFSLYDPAGIQNQHVIGALNSRELTAFTVGQRIYFSSIKDTTGYANFGPCPANGIPLPIPHVILSGFSSSPCAGN